MENKNGGLFLRFVLHDIARQAIKCLAYLNYNAK